jgi:inosine/xanthosine triphosphatase
MATMQIAVGSTRRPKLNAVTEAVSSFASHLHGEFNVIGFEVESGVSHTPSTREELMRGARQRAEALATHCQSANIPTAFYVGLEGGLDQITENDITRVFLESWAYVTDGRTGHFGSSGSIELPAALAEEVLVRGTELSAAIDRFAGAAGIRDAQGAWGVLSGNLVTRQESFRLAVVTAFAPFFNQKIYQGAAVAGA